MCSFQEFIYHAVKRMLQIKVMSYSDAMVCVSVYFFFSSSRVVMKLSIVKKTQNAQIYMLHILFICQYYSQI